MWIRCKRHSETALNQSNPQEGLFVFLVLTRTELGGGGGDASLILTVGPVSTTLCPSGTRFRPLQLDHLQLDFDRRHCVAPDLGRDLAHTQQNNDEQHTQCPRWDIPPNV